MGLTDDVEEPPPVPQPAAPGASLSRRLLPYASIAGGLFLFRIVLYALKRRHK